jgi:hypothetical protein
MGGHQSCICAVAAAFVVAGLQPSFAHELPFGRELPVSASAAVASCDVVVCSYVTKTVICHRLVRACAYRPSPRPIQPHPHKPQ